MKAIWNQSLKLALPAAVAAVLPLGGINAVHAQTDSVITSTLGAGDGSRYYSPETRSYFQYYFTDPYCQDYRRRFQGATYDHYCYRGIWTIAENYVWTGGNNEWDSQRANHRDANDKWDRETQGRADHDDIFNREYDRNRDGIPDTGSAATPATLAD